MKTLLAVLMVVLISGCLTFERLGAYVQDNPIFAEPTAVQLVVRIRDRSPFPEERGKRIESVLTKLRAYLSGTGSVTIDALEELVKKNTNWDKMARADQLLVKQISTIIKDVYLPEDKVSPLSEEARVALENLLDKMVYEVRVF